MKEKKSVRVKKTEEKMRKRSMTLLCSPWEPAAPYEMEKATRGYSAVSELRDCPFNGKTVFPTSPPSWCGSTTLLALPP